MIPDDIPDKALAVRFDHLDKMEEDEYKTKREYEDNHREEQDPIQRRKIEKHLNECKERITKIRDEKAEIRAQQRLNDRMPDHIRSGLEVLRDKQDSDDRDIQFRRAPFGVTTIGLEPPPATTHFIGRREKLRELFAAINSSDARVITILGTSGMGKTALARQILKEVINPQSEFALEGVKGIVYLSAQTTGITFRNIYFACAQLFGKNEAELKEAWGNIRFSYDRANQLLKNMKGGWYFVLLDNLETEVDAGGSFCDEEIQSFFEAIRDQPTETRVRVLITSQAPLNCRLSHPHMIPVKLEDGLSTEEALTFLRGIGGKHTTVFSNLSNLELLNIVGGTGCIPRAIELVANLLLRGKRLDAVQSLTEESGADRKHLVELLSKAAYEILDVRSRRVLEALAIYEYPAPVIAIMYMLWKTAPDADADAIIKDLRSTHAITQETYRDGGTVAALMSLHPTDRVSILQQMDDKEQRYANTVAAEFYSLTYIRKPWIKASQLEPHRAEIKHLLRSDNYDRALHVLNDICYSWKNHHKFLAHLKVLGLGWWCVEKRIEVAGKSSGTELSAHNLVSVAWLYRRMDKLDEAKKYFQQALEMSLKAESPNATIFALTEYGYYLTDNVNSDHSNAEAERLLNQARDLAGVMSPVDNYGRAHALLGLAFVSFQRGANEQSIAMAREAQSGFHNVLTPLGRYREVDCLVRLGMTYRKMGQFDQGIQVGNEALAITTQHRMPDWEAELSSQLAFNYRAVLDHSSAIVHQERALTLFQKQGGVREGATQQSYLGNLYLEVGRTEEAKTAYVEAMRIAQRIGLTRETSWIISNLGVLRARFGDYQAALDLQEQARHLLGGGEKHADSRAIRDTDLAYTYLLQRDYGSALRSIRRSLGDFAQVPAERSIEEMVLSYHNDRYREDSLPHEMQSPFDHERRGIIASRIYLHTGRVQWALEMLEAATPSKSESPRLHFLSALKGVCCLLLGDVEDARLAFFGAIRHAEMLNSGYLRFYSKALSHAGLALLENGNYHLDHLSQAKRSYEDALSACAILGVKRDAFVLLRELKPQDDANVVASLESVFTNHSSSSISLD